MRGKLIIIESGTDASGKATQTGMLVDRLSHEGYNVRKIEYPDYKSDSSALIKMYLNGEFGTKPGEINPYAASTFYAVDRYASFHKEWKPFYEKGGIVIADRYTTSNMVYQASKIDDKAETDKYLEWLWDLEFNKFMLPVPDCIIFLDMPPSVSRRLMEQRKNKFTGDKQKDIHERNYEYLVKSYMNACRIAASYGWQMVKCCNGSVLRSIEDIHDEIYCIIKRMI